MYSGLVHKKRESNMKNSRWSGIIFLAGLLTLSLMRPTPMAAADWPGFLGPNRDGNSPDTGLLKQWPADGPPLLWKLDDIGPGWSSMAVVGGNIYTTGNSGGNQMLICLDSGGKTKWRVKQGPKCEHRGYSGARSTPTIGDGGE